MNWVFTSVLIISVLQFFLCKSVDWFWLCFLLLLIERGLFFASLIGATIKSKALIVTDVFSVAMLLIFNVLSKSPNNYLGMLLYLLFSAACCALIWVDDKFYVKETTDYFGEEEE